MRLGGTIAGRYAGPGEWERLLVASKFRAVTAPFTCHTPRDEVRAYCEIAKKHDVVIAEVGVWKNVFNPDPAKAAAAMAYAKGQLALADELGIACCVNIAGTAGSAGWDGADESNYTKETYERIVASVREILDDVKPTRSWYCLEPMPWMVPDGPEEYLKLIRDIDRPMFGAHMDFVNMINSPRRYLCADEFVEECFAKLGPYIKSTHIKDSHMDRMKLTTVLTECSPGEGELDIEKVLRSIERHLPADAPVLLEHMETFEEYQTAYEAVAAAAGRAGIAI
ncbi:MAG: sugar phosphate isomerase/epimerase [Lachnospiraceae bacterium]|nr:sugar phosphate isomerase/epimerase [Lachnospiraceae bacterium]